MRTHTSFWSRTPSLVGLASVLGAVSALAAEEGLPVASEPSVPSALGGGFLQLLGAVIQLIIALSIAAYAIKKGFDLLGKLLNRGGKTLDLWQEIRNKNVAVAAVSAAVIFSYCNVIGSGIDSMSSVLSNIAHRGAWQSIVGIISAIVNLAVAIGVASFAITVVFQVMGRLTSDFDDIGELKANNIAVGVMYCGLIIGVSFLVSSGVTSVGMGVNAVLDALLRMVGIS
jgi:uncharacterized membrane protein YjfL (UPF0719 family)